MTKTNNEEQTFKYAKIHVIYNNTTYSSIWLDLRDNEYYNEIIFTISEFGTSNIEALKIPRDNNSFMVFSREQLDYAIIEIQLANKRTK